MQSLPSIHLVSAIAASAALVAACNQREPSPEAPAPSGAATVHAAGEAEPESEQGKSEDASGPVLSAVADVAVGEQMDCARKQDGSVWCWTSGGEAKRSIMVEADKVAVVGSFVCAIQTKGQIACSLPYSGKIIDVPLYRDGVTVVGGPEGYCVDTEDGVLRCGVEDRDQHKVKPPSGLPGLKHASGFSVGMRHGFGVVEGDVWCWNNEKGAGLPKTMAPVEGAQSVAVGRQRSCVLTQSGEVWCYDVSSSDKPFKAKPHKQQGWSGTAALTMAYAEDHPDRLCALKKDGTVGCAGLRGDGESASFPAPAAIEGIRQAVQLATGATSHGCVRTQAGTVQCWTKDAGRAVAVREASGGATVPASVKQ